MPRFEYQFDTKIDDRSRRFKRRLRLILLFLLISGITAGAIWLIIPKNNGTIPEKNAIVVPASVTADKNEKAPEAESVAASQKNISIQENTSVDGISGVTETKKDAGEKGLTDKPVPTEVPTVLPEKGKIWAGDPAVDVPEKVKDKAVSTDGGELAMLLSKSEYNALADKAVEVIRGENEGSSNYRQAAEYLLKARVAQLASSSGVPGISYRYTVRGGDSLSRIARRNKTTVAGLMLYNRLDNGFIRIGNRFIVHKGGWRIEVSKSKRLLKLYNNAGNEKLFAVFEVGVGRLNSTPSGGFVISNRIKSPVWHAPDGSVFEPGEPGNELGNFFLKLASTGSPDRPLAGYGIHGTPDESTVGKSLSSGCIRMRNADVELLYNLVPERTPVNITE